MNISGTKNGRIALGNLSNLSNVPSTLSNLKSPIGNNTLYQIKKVNQNICSTSKPKVIRNSTHIKQIDSENFNFRTSISAFKEVHHKNLNSDKISEPPKFQRDYRLQVEKVSESSHLLEEDSLKSVNDKREFIFLDSDFYIKEERFGEPYLIDEDIFVEDYCTKKLKTATNQVVFVEEFQAVLTKNDTWINPENEDIVNIYEDFSIDLSFLDGIILTFESLINIELIVESIQENYFEKDVACFIENDLNDFSNYHTNTLFE